MLKPEDGRPDVADAAHKRHRRKLPRVGSTLSETVKGDRPQRVVLGQYQLACLSYAAAYATLAASACITSRLRQKWSTRGAEFSTPPRQDKQRRTAYRQGQCRHVQHPASPPKKKKGEEKEKPPPKPPPNQQNPPTPPRFNRSPGVSNFHNRPCGRPSALQDGTNCLVTPRHLTPWRVGYTHVVSTVGVWSASTERHTNRSKQVGSPVLTGRLPV